MTTAFDDLVNRRGEIVGKHAGAGASAFFLSETSGGDSAAADAAITTACALPGALRDHLGSMPDDLGLRVDDGRFNIGVHWGAEVFIGQVVTGGRLEVTALGDEVNECARLEQTACGGRALASRALVERLDDDAAHRLGLRPPWAGYVPLSDLGPDAKANRDAGTLLVTELPPTRARAAPTTDLGCESHDETHSGQRGAPAAAAEYLGEAHVSLQEIDYSLGCAVVTGGTSGIGRAIAEELATRGVRRMVVVARGEDRLTETAASIERDVPGTSVRTISVDLDHRDGPAEVQRQVAEWGWDVELLVNDAGFARKEVFAEDPGSDTALAAVDLMVRAPVELMLRFLPDMRRRGRGGVLNLGSTAGQQPVPYSAAYAASKAFVISFSQAIREENRGSGVRVACIVPGVTETDLDGDGHGERRGALDKVGIDQPADVAKVAVAALEANDAARVVGLNNKLFQAALHLTPDSLSARLIAGVRGAPGQE